jgi:hypothetical protein
MEFDADLRVRRSVSVLVIEKTRAMFRVLGSIAFVFLTSIRKSRPGSVAPSSGFQIVGAGGGI